MLNYTLQPGDRVIYLDTDKIPWGPWEITAVWEGEVTINVDGCIECRVEARRLSKVEPDR